MINKKFYIPFIIYINIGKDKKYESKWYCFSIFYFPVSNPERSLFSFEYHLCDVYDSIVMHYLFDFNIEIPVKWRKINEK